MAKLSKKVYYHEGPDGKMHPDLVKPEYGEWGAARLRYMKQYLPEELMELLRNCELNHYLNKLDRRAMDKFESLVAQKAKHHGVTEELKERDTMQWIGLMGNIQHEVTQIIEETFIY